MERGRLSRRARIAIAIVALGLAAAVALFAVRRAGDGRAANATPSAAVDSLAMAPPGVRVRVEVLNASARRGLARRATMYLRDLGYDVVANGNAAERRDSTLVLQRAGAPDWGRRASRAVGGAPLEVRPDSTRYVDVTVLLGRDWEPPPGPLRP